MDLETKIRSEDLSTPEDFRMYLRRSILTEDYNDEQSLAMIVKAYEKGAESVKSIVDKDEFDDPLHLVNNWFVSVLIHNSDETIFGRPMKTIWVPNINSYKVETNIYFYTIPWTCVNAQTFDIFRESKDLHPVRIVWEHIRPFSMGNVLAPRQEWKRFSEKRDKTTFDRDKLKQLFMSCRIQAHLGKNPWEKEF